MGTCRLIKNNNDLWTATAKVTKHIPLPGGFLDPVETIDVVENKTLEECSEFLMNHGVDDGEIDAALKCMTEQDHNVSEFGIYGSFLFSKYHGALQ